MSGHDIAILPELQSKYGDFIIPVVLAHEFGHVVQQRSGFFDQNELTASLELQADCFAGGWSKHAQDSGLFKVSAGDLDTALAGILDLKNSPGTNVQDPSAQRLETGWTGGRGDAFLLAGGSTRGPPGRTNAPLMAMIEEW